MSYRRALCLYLVETNPGKTARELSVILAEEDSEFEQDARDAIRPAITWLHQNGWIHEGDKRRCEESGRLAFTYWSKDKIIGGLFE
jgi:hypothetical protein